MEVNGQLHAPAALPPGKEPLGGPQSRSERDGEEKNSQLLPGLESPITLTTSPSSVLDMYIGQMRNLCSHLKLRILAGHY
jgi:hypothetical protein